MHWKPFLFIHTISIFLLATWLWPASFIYWKSLDVAAFQFLNLSLIDAPISQIFWAIGNVRAVDLIGAIFMILFMALYASDVPVGKERTLRIAHAIFICIWFEIGILFTKEGVDAFIQYNHFMRNSPTVDFSDAVMLSDAIPWLKVKDVSRSCFPGDHAEILIQWALFIFAVCGTRYGLLATPIALFFILPRLVGGAHWLSDALVGSLSIALSVLAWAMYSPLHRYTMQFSLWIVNTIQKLFSNKESR